MSWDDLAGRDINDFEEVEEWTVMVFLHLTEEELEAPRT